MSVFDRVLDHLGLAPEDFDPSDPTPDQAVVDLLTLAMLVDGTTTDAERERLRAHLATQDWPDGTNPYSYADAAVARVREALAEPVALERLLASIAERLRCDDDRELALGLTRELAGLDGTVDASEQGLIDGLRHRFEAGA